MRVDQEQRITNSDAALIPLTLWLDFWQKQVRYGLESWAGVVHVCGRHGPFRHHVCQPCEDAQLIVPDPIVEDGEHALFA